MARGGLTRGRLLRRGLGLALVMVVAVWAAQWTLRASRPWMAHYWAGQLETANAPEAALLCKRLATLGEPGLPLLAAALASPREPVAQAAANALSDELILWKRLPAEVTSPLLAALAQGLAKHTEQYGTTSQRVAARLAEQILTWPTDDQLIDRLQLVTDCERVLRARQMPPMPERDLVGPHGYSPAPIARDDSFPLAPQTLGSSLPGGGLPIKSVPGLPIDELPKERPEMAGIGARPQPQVASNPAGPRHLNQPVPDEEELSRDLEMADRVLPAAQPAEQARPVLAEDVFQRLREAPEQLTLAELFHLTELPDQQTSELASAALRKRGLTAADLEVGRRIVSGPIDQRRLWVERLPRIPSIDARPWLLIASEDPDAQVRRTALTLMATTPDPRLLDRVSQMARADADPEVQVEASRIMAARANRQQR